MHLFFRIQNLQLLIFNKDDQEVLANFGYVFYVFYCNIIKIKHLCIILSRLIFSFTYIVSLLLPYAYVPVESIYCILLSSFESNFVNFFIKNIMSFTFKSLFCLRKFINFFSKNIMPVTFKSLFGF